MVPACKSSISEADFVIPTRKNLSHFLKHPACFALAPLAVFGRSRVLRDRVHVREPTSLFCAMSSRSLMFASIISTRERSALRRFRLDRNRCASRSVISCRVMPARTPSWDSSSSMCSWAAPEFALEHPCREEGGFGNGGRTFGGCDKEELVRLRLGIVLQLLRHARIELVDAHGDLGTVDGEPDPILIEDDQSGITEELMHARRIEEPQVGVVEQTGRRVREMSAQELGPHGGVRHVRE